MIYLTLINNIAILVALSVFYSFISRKWDFNTVSHQVWSGILFSAVSIIGMLNPLVLKPGIIFDGRSIIISIAGLFGGPITAIITAIINAGYRIYLGGPGALMGVSVISSSAVIGVVYYYLRKKKPNTVKSFHLWIFGMIVHSSMLICTLALPSTVRYEIFSQIMIPVLTIYPVGTLLVCILFLNHEDQIKYEEALKQSEKNLSSIKKHFEISMQATNSSTYDINFTADQITISNALWLHLGYDPGNLPSSVKNLMALIHPDDIPVLLNYFNDKYKGEDPAYYFEIRFLSKSGEWIWCGATGKIIEFNEDDTPRRTLGTISEISDRKRVEEERIRLQNLESLGILAGGIAHDFNNILTNIMGQASMALENMKDTHSNSVFSSILEASRRAVGLTHQLLTFAKGGAPQKDIIRIEKIIEDTARFSLSGSNVEPVFNFNHTLAMEADQGQIAQVIQNIVINAKQAMPSGGKVEITTEDVLDAEDKDFILIRIKDTGSGIPDEFLSKIFDPYFSTKSTGSGLGLSVCHSIINKHGGKVTVESSAETGTVFEILLPATDQTVNVQTETRTNSIPKLKVLVMDDDQEIRELLTAMLNRLGHSAVSTRDGNEAIKAFNNYLEKNELFDVVFLDLTIKGGLGGIETFKILKNLKTSTKFVVSSGYAENTVEDYYKEAFDARLDKPYTIEQLKSILIKIFASQ